MKPYVIGFGVGFLLAWMLCVVPRHIEGSYERMTSPPTLVQYDEHIPSPFDLEEPDRFDRLVFPPMPRFKPSPPLYNWQLPCP